MAEGPGDTEDLEGIPLIGPAGGLIDQIVWQVDQRLEFEYTRAFANTIGCIPKKGGVKIGEPGLDELEACQEKMKEIVGLVNPDLLVLVGRVAQEWCPTFFPEIPQAKMIHPAAILKGPRYQRDAAIQISIENLEAALNRHFS